MGTRLHGHWSRAPWFLVAPPEQASHVAARPRLHTLLDDAVARSPITLVVAPPGYGKTTALAAWEHRTPRPTAWLSLTRHDLEGRQFTEGLVSALLRLAERQPSILDDLPGSLTETPDPATVVDQLTRLALTRSEPIVVVVDDAQFADPSDVVEVVETTTERCGGLFRFVLAGAGELDTWFNRHVVDGRASLLTARDLAFTAEEIEAAVLVSGQRISEPTAAVAHAESGGWPVAVRLALLTADRHTPGTSTQLPDAADDLLTGYVVESVLQQLRPELADFVLATTTCSRLDADLAEALSGNHESPALLEECVRRGLFLDRYVNGDDDTVYRWHDVFARHCRIVLRRRNHSRSRQLDLTAAGRLAATFPIEAMVHATRAGAPDRAVEIIRHHWVRLVIESDAANLNARCLALPPEWNSTPEVLLVRACCLDVLGDTAGSALLFDRARAATRDDDSAHVAAARAFAELFLADDATDLAAAADRVRAALGTGAAAHHANTHGLFLLGWVELRLRRDPAAAVRFLTSARDEARTSGHRVLARRAGANLTFALAFSGRLTQARRAAELDDDRAPDPQSEWFHYDGGIEHFARGFVDYWQNDLAAARAHFRALALAGGHDGSYAALARVYFALTVAAAHDLGAVDEAEYHLDHVSRDDVHGVPWPAYRAIAAAELAAMTGDMGTALRLVQPLSTVGDLPVVTAHVADLYRRAGKPDEAAGALRRIRGVPTSFVRASGLVTASRMTWDRGDRDRAHRQLEQALDVATPEGAARPFGNGSKQFRAFLAEHAVWGTRHEDFIATRLAPPTSEVPRRQAYGISLTAREREIFGFLCTRMTSAEIAAKLYVSVNTVRTHQRSIYRKLGVTTRREAVRIHV
ncbi:LuxR C-terminal-related transcriptional regulator [Rhodococcus sp. NPDC004095]